MSPWSVAAMQKAGFAHEIDCNCDAFLRFTASRRQLRRLPLEGVVDVYTVVASMTAQKPLVGHDDPVSANVGSTKTTFQALRGPLGLVELQISPPPSVATHSIVDEHEELTKGKLLRRRSVGCQVLIDVALE